jgi:hypothetical protein
MLNPDLSRSESDVPSHHLEASVTQNLLEREYIAAVYQVIGGEGMAAKMGVETSYSCFLTDTLQNQPNCLIAYRITIQAQEQVIVIISDGLGPEMENIPLENFLS